jgi:hypothetical protein
MGLAERIALREDAALLLAELGDTADEVVAFLAWMGAGVTGASGGDSLATSYLHAVIGADPRVRRVRITKRRMGLKTTRRWRSTVWVALPRPVRQFVTSVDGHSTPAATQVPPDGTPDPGSARRQ